MVVFFATILGFRIGQFDRAVVLCEVLAPLASDSRHAMRMLSGNHINSIVIFS